LAWPQPRCGHCAPIVRSRINEHGRARHGKAARKWPGEWHRATASGPPRVDGVAGACRRADALCGSNPAKPQRLLPDSERMEKDADLAWLLGGTPLPLTLLTQLAGATVANARRKHHAQAPIGLSTSFMGMKRPVCGTTQRPIRLEGKVSSRETPGFPGRGGGGWAVAKGRRNRGGTRGSLLILRQEGRSKLGEPQRRRGELMPQFEPDIPDPLSYTLPGFLSRGRVAAPSVGIDLQVFVRERRRVMRRDASTICIVHPLRPPVAPHRALKNASFV
jgi:hypothetical protein